MEQEAHQVAQAIAIASNPAQSDLHRQALEFLGTVERNANETWKVGLALFVDTNGDGTRKHDPQARFYGLGLLDAFLDNRYESLDEDSFTILQKAFIQYIQSEYVYGGPDSSSSYLRNKFSHTLTLLFLCTYLERWPSFFNDLFALIRTSQSDSSQPQLNMPVSLLLFHIVLEISGEVADQMMKAARVYSPLRHTRDARVRDAVRERDAASINQAVLTIIADGVNKLALVRKGELDLPMARVEEVVDWGIRSFGSYVGWIDINLTVTPSTIMLLFSSLSDSALSIRLATAVALLRMVSKGLKEPADKIKLLKVLALGQVLAALEERTRAEQHARGKDTDDGEETYREALGRLLNALGMELTKLSEEPQNGQEGNEEVRAEAASMLEELMPIMLRFLADPYDDTSSTVFPLLSSVLIGLKKLKRSAPQEITPAKLAFLSSVLEVLLQKMTWDEDDDPDEMDDDDKHAFDSLRKGELRSHLDNILVIDSNLVIQAVSSVVMDTLSAYEGGSSLQWNRAELAIYLIYIFGEINKAGGKGRAAFCQAPAVAKELRKSTDYSEFPLTTHGEMLYALVRSNICNYPHPAVTMQFFETCARYSDFFKVRRECIIPLLEAMVGVRGVHHPLPSVHSRVFYLFHKFVKEDRNELPPEVVTTLLNGIRDVLRIEVELPKETESTELSDILSEAVNNMGTFDSQLYLFEAAGNLISLKFKSQQETEQLLLSVVQPLLDELSGIIVKAQENAQDVVAILKVHHVIMALGNIAKGFPDFPSPIPENYITPPIEVFRQMARAIIVSLEAMNVFKVVRDATRFAFARIVATTGSSVTDFIPALMTNLLAHFEPTELVDFMNFIGLLMHRLQGEMGDVLDQLIGPLSARIRDLLSQPVMGTDDKLSHAETKKAYLSLVNNVMVNKLHKIFISERNKPQFETFLGNMIAVAEDVTDAPCQKIALMFIQKCISAWCVPVPDQHAVNGNGIPHADTVPGFEHFVYERLVPMSFRIPSSPQFNIKDGQSLVVLNEIATLLQTVVQTRKQEAFDFLVNVFLPSQNWPPETAIDFANKMRDLDNKPFRKYFTDFVRASRAPAS